MSEQILLLNPRGRRRRAYNRRPRRARRSNTRRRRARRLPVAMRMSNPRRHHRRRNRHHRRRKAVARMFNPRVRRHYRRSNRRYRRRNPSFRGMGSSAKGFVMRLAGPVVIGAAGGVALDVIWGYASPNLTFLPASLQTGWGALATKLAAVFGGAMLLNRYVIKSPSQKLLLNRAVLGAATVVTYGAIRGALHTAAPTLPGLAGYMDYHSYSLPGTTMAGYMPRNRATLGSLEDLYSPAAVIQPQGTPVPRQFGGFGCYNGYIAAQPGGLGAYQPHMQADAGLSGYDWRNDGM